VLFTLHFELTGPPGEYPVTIIQTTIRNRRAGYKRSGELIPFLMGYSGDTEYQTHSVAKISPATIVVKPPFTDNDSDGGGMSDPAGNRYNPTLINATGGSGFVPRGTNALPANDLTLAELDALHAEQEQTFQDGLSDDTKVPGTSLTHRNLQAMYEQQQQNLTWGQASKLTS